MSLLAPGWCLSCKSIAELLTSCYLLSTQTQTLPLPGYEAGQRCPINPKCTKVIRITSLHLPKVFNAILVAYVRCLWVWAAESAFFLMVIYAQITLGSIISLLCAVAAHNSRGELDRDTSAADRKHNASFQIQLLLSMYCL